MKTLSAVMLIFLLTWQASAQTTVNSGQKTFDLREAHSAVAVPTEKPDMFPMALGNRYQYLEDYASFTGNYGTHHLTEVKIVKDSIISGKKYYYYSWLDDKNYFRYDRDSNKLYYRYQNMDLLYADFTQGNGSKYLCISPYIGAWGWLEATVSAKNYNIFGQSRTGYSHLSISINEGFNDVFVSGLGSIRKEWTYFGGPNFKDDQRLINAIIYDSTGNFTVYTENLELAYRSSPFTAVGANPVFEYSCLIQHPYDARNWNGSSSTYGRLFLDSVTLFYYYRNGSNKTEIKSVASSMVNWQEYKFKLNIDTSLIKRGYVLDYKIVSKDKSLIPRYFSWPNYGYFTAVYNPALGVSSNISSAESFMLNQNYPNPFNPATSISFTIAERGQAKMTIFNSVGEQVRVLLDENKEPGKYTLQFDGSELPSGIYYCRLVSGTSASTMKMVLLK